MAPTNSKKRRVPLAEEDFEHSGVSEDDFEVGLLDGAVSESEDEDEDEDEDEEEDEEDDDDDSAIDSSGQDSEDEDEEDEKDDGSPSDRPAVETKLSEMALTAPDKFSSSRKIVLDSAGNQRYMYPEIDPVYDSDDTDAEETNTIGNIPLDFYDEYPHVGYDINGRKIMRPAKGEALDALLETIEVPRGWTGLTDRNTGTGLKLTDEELEMVRKIQMDENIEGYDPYQVSLPKLRERERERKKEIYGITNLPTSQPSNTSPPKQN